MVVYKCNHCGETFSYEPILCNECGNRFSALTFTTLPQKVTRNFFVKYGLNKHPIEITFTTAITVVFEYTDTATKKMGIILRAVKKIHELAECDPECESVDDICIIVLTSLD